MMLSFNIDMNLSKEWVDEFARHGWKAVHWSDVGAADAPDTVVMAWARQYGHIVFTHDLDFGTVLALTQETGPSVVQVRAQNLLPEHLGKIARAGIERYWQELTSGALVVIDEARSRVRVLPIRKEAKT